MGQSAVPEADFSVPEVFKDGRGDGFRCAAAADDAVAPIVLRGAGPAPSCQRERPWIFFPLRDGLEAKQFYS